MSKHTLVITIDGGTDDIMSVAVEEVADQLLRGMRSGHIPIMDGIEWSMREMPRPADIDMRQRRAAALLLMAVGEAPTLTGMAGSMQEATLACPGLVASDLPTPTSEGRLEALREARSLIDQMLGEQP